MNFAILATQSRQQMHSMSAVADAEACHAVGSKDAIVQADRRTRRRQRDSAEPTRHAPNGRGTRRGSGAGDIE
jgi:hypothetical protein